MARVNVYLSPQCDYILVDQDQDGDIDQIRETRSLCVGEPSSLLGRENTQKTIRDYYRQATVITRDEEGSRAFMEGQTGLFKDWATWRHHTYSQNTSPKPASTPRSTAPQPKAPPQSSPQSSPATPPRYVPHFALKIPDFEAITGLIVIPRGDIPWMYGDERYPDATDHFFDAATGQTFTFVDLQTRYGVILKEWLSEQPATETPMSFGYAADDYASYFDTATSRFENGRHMNESGLMTEHCYLEENLQDLIQRMARVTANPHPDIHDHSTDGFWSVFNLPGQYYPGLASFIENLHGFLVADHPQARKSFQCYKSRDLSGVLFQNVSAQTYRAIHEILKKDNQPSAFVFDSGNFDIEPYLPAGLSSEDRKKAQAIFVEAFQARVKAGFTKLTNEDGTPVTLDIEFYDAPPDGNQNYTPIRLISDEPYTFYDEGRVLDALYYNFMFNRRFRPQLIAKYGPKIHRDHPDYDRAQALKAARDPLVRSRINQNALGVHMSNDPNNALKLDTGDTGEGEVHIYANPIYRKGKTKGTFKERRLQVRVNHWESDLREIAHAFAHVAIHEVGHSLGLLYGFNAKLATKSDPFQIGEVVHHNRRPRRKRGQIPYTMHQTRHKTWEDMTKPPTWHPYSAHYLHYFFGTDYREERASIVAEYSKRRPEIEMVLDSGQVLRTEMDD